MEFGAVTHPGLRRTTSDDHFLIVELGRSQQTIASSLPPDAVPDRFDERAFGMVVADGMGPDGPEMASRLALATLAQLVLQYGKWNVRVNERTAWEIVQRAERFYRRVGETVTDASHQHPSLAGMSTTLTAAFSGGDELFVVHVGHSRAYLYRGGLLTRLTRDQTLAQRLVGNRPDRPDRARCPRPATRADRRASAATPASPTSRSRTTCCSTATWCCSAPTA